MVNTVEITAIPGVPDINPGDSLSQILGDCLERSIGLRDGDILCIAHKVFSKAGGHIIDLSNISPSREANELAIKLNKNPQKVEVILQQSSRIVRAFKRPEQNEGTLICEHKLGFISANAAVDESNVADENSVITLPNDPDACVHELGKSLEDRFSCHIGIVMTDTFGRPWRLGQVNVAVGLYRVPARKSEVGNTDGWGRPLSVTEPAFADELAAASGLTMAKAARTPMILMRGIEWTPEETTSARNLVRASQEDMFR